MKRKALAIFLALLLIAAASGQSNPQKEQKESVQDLKKKIQSLETKILFMQARIAELESRRCDRAPLVPVPEGEMPPGAKPFYFNGMQFWQLPASPDNAQDVRR
jgi:hypothetical protein